MRFHAASVAGRQIHKYLLNDHDSNVLPSSARDFAAPGYRTFVCRARDPATRAITTASREAKIHAGDRVWPWGWCGTSASMSPASADVNGCAMERPKCGTYKSTYAVIPFT